MFLRPRLNPRLSGRLLGMRSLFRSVDSFCCYAVIARLEKICLTAEREPELIRRGKHVRAELFALAHNVVSIKAAKAGESLTVECEEVLLRIQSPCVPPFEDTEKLLCPGTVGAALDLNSGRSSSMHDIRHSQAVRDKAAPLLSQAANCINCTQRLTHPPRTHGGGISRISLRRECATLSSSLFGIRIQYLSLDGVILKLACSRRPPQRAGGDSPGHARF
ncbi:hypothetical protein DFH11DRAFT_1728702 [Phellopilus nigrolimitatus]|nr:hypothetical protein DFH11DRAFT_1728702 [Phellopilus nigrolimitatus]